MVGVKLSFYLSLANTTREIRQRLLGGWAVGNRRQRGLGPFFQSYFLAVVDEDYSVTVRNVQVLRGNTAILR